MCALHLPLVTIALKTGLTDSKDNELVLGSHTAVTEDRTDESTTTNSLRVGGIDSGLEEILKFKKLWINAISQPKEGVSRIAKRRITRSTVTLEGGDDKKTVKPPSYVTSMGTASESSNSSSTDASVKVPTPEPTSYVTSTDTASESSNSSSADTSDKVSTPEPTSYVTTSESSNSSSADTSDKVPTPEPTSYVTSADTASESSNSSSADASDKVPTPEPTSFVTSTDTASDTSLASSADKSSKPTYAPNQIASAGTGGIDGSGDESATTVYQYLGTHPKFSLFLSLMFIIIIVYLIKKCKVIPSTDERYTRVPQGDMGDVSIQLSEHSCLMMTNMIKIDYDFLIEVPLLISKIIQGRSSPICLHFSFDCSKSDIKLLTKSSFYDIPLDLDATMNWNTDANPAKKQRAVIILDTIIDIVKYCKPQ